MGLLQCPNKAVSRVERAVTTSPESELGESWQEREVAISAHQEVAHHIFSTLFPDALLVQGCRTQWNEMVSGGYRGQMLADSGKW